MKQETVSGNSISWAVCKSAPHSRQIDNHTSSFLKAGCFSCRPTNNVKALKARTASESNLHRSRYACVSVGVCQCWATHWHLLTAAAWHVSQPAAAAPSPAYLVIVMLTCVIPIVVSARTAAVWLGAGRYCGWRSILHQPQWSHHQLEWPQAHRSLLLCVSLNTHTLV